MKQLTCEMCGSTDLIKSEGVFVCQSCGTKYSVEEAKKMMIEGTVVVRGAVQVDATNQIENFLKRAEIAMQEHKFKEANDIANKILDINVECGEAYEILLLCDIRMLYKDLLQSPKNIAENENYAKIKKFSSAEVFDKYEKLQNIYLETEYQKAVALYNSGNCDAAIMSEAEIIIRPLALVEYKDSKEVHANIYKDIEKVKKKIECLPEEEYNFTYGGCNIIKFHKEGYVIIATRQGSKTFYFWDIKKIEIEKDLYSRTIKIEGIECVNRTSVFSLFLCDEKDWLTVRKALIEIVNRMKIVGNTSFYTNIFGFDNNSGLDNNWEFFDEAGSTFNIEVKDNDFNIVETKKDGTIKKENIKYCDIIAISFKSFIFNQYKIDIKCKGKAILVLILTKEDGKSELQNLYDELKKKTPHSTEKTGGCYVATCVYGSYDCPQVWTLRRYRDNTLGSTWYGRAFIRTYYAISPTLVKWFGKTKWFKKMWKGTLDRMVKKLNDKGVEDTPYKDKQW